MGVPGQHRKTAQGSTPGTEIRMQGILNTDKPLGWTSRRVVDRIKAMVRPAKAGHAGTLDPLATGVLLVAVGDATKLLAHLQRLPKTYRAEIQLGVHSASHDLECELEERPLPADVSAEAIEAAIPEFLGTILQRPPSFSALKVSGKRSYVLARRGQVVELVPRPISIRSLRLVSWERPKLELEIECGSGTYIRSLARDMAQRLGTSGVLTALARTRIGPFCLEASIDPAMLRTEELAGHVQPLMAGICGLPQRTVLPDEVHRLHQGQAIADFGVEAPKGASEAEDAVIAAVDGTGQLVSLLRRRGDGQLWPYRNFSPCPVKATEQPARTE